MYQQRSRHLGISPEACENAEGHYFRSPCFALQTCINDHKNDGEEGFSKTFEKFAIKFEIEDASDEDECELARTELGFEPDYIDDTEVCDKFNDYLCDKFFDGIDIETEDLDKPKPFEPITYQPIA